MPCVYLRMLPLVGESDRGQREEKGNIQIIAVGVSSHTISLFFSRMKELLSVAS